MGIRNFSWRVPVALILLLLGLAIGTAPSHADPPPAKARIGDLTFYYDPFNWRFELAGTGLTVTCLQVDCRGAVFDFSVRDASGECGEEAVRRTAELLFPAADRHPVNIVPAGRFGLVKAESRYGPDLQSPTYVYACLDWQDREYRFATRPETVGRMSWAGGALHYLVSRATAPPARIATVRLRDLEIPYSTEIWRATEFVPRESHRLLFCLPPTCDGHGGFVTVSAKPAAGCEPDPAGLSLPQAILTPLHAGSDGPQFTVTTIHSPCRNYVPPIRRACLWHNGVAYRIVTGGLGGCRSDLGVPAGAFTELVNAARLAP
ncbi:hypothetical protein [Mesorhizobium australicum]|uniref:TonB C-terminal domain-containing protein n=1 Tax=Mesorhizobium australicum TaxID=536018 RepID=A0A1X7P0X2_9HYPH|nr:hypothetical protein [Mesorhizobium australicum]SMH44392.1 hypothetical protein SAMN02982922_3046 [Mesorhizobium australicum]